MLEAPVRPRTEPLVSSTLRWAGPTPFVNSDGTSSASSGGRPEIWGTPSGDDPSTGATPVPAPPMVLLFGAAAATLVARRRLGRKKDEAA